MYFHSALGELYEELDTDHNFSDKLARKLLNEKIKNWLQEVSNNY